MHDNEFSYYDLTNFKRSEAQFHVWADPEIHPWSMYVDLGCAKDWPPGPWDEDYVGIPKENLHDEMQQGD